MHAFTLRLEPSLSKKLNQICKKKGYSKTKLVKTLIKDFVELTDQSTPRKLILEPEAQYQALKNLVGIVSLGGDAVEDCETAYFE